MLVYADDKEQVHVLEFENMEQSLLCKRPNCDHSGEDCIQNRLKATVPVFRDHTAYYFVDDSMHMEQGDDGKPRLKLGTWLCSYDLAEHKEKKLLRIEDAAATEPGCNMLLHGDTMYFETYAPEPVRDENGMALGYTNHGGNVSLAAIHLPDLQLQELGSLYDLHALTEYFPYAPNSAEINMQGLFNNRIYFNIAFVEGSGDPTTQYFPYRHYVTYYDLSDGSYHGTPEDYAHIDFQKIVHLSAEHLAIYDEMKQTVSVYAPDGGEPVVLSDESFQDYADYAVFNDILFCYPKAFDLNSNAVYEMTDEKYPIVVAAYGGDYVCADVNYASFEKIPAEKLLKPAQG